MSNIDGILARLLKASSRIEGDSNIVFDGEISASSDVSIMLNARQLVVLTVRVEYTVGSGNVRVYWLFSQDGINYDTFECAESSHNYIEIPNIGTAQQITFMLIPLLKRTKIVIKNFSGGNVRVKMWAMI